MSVPNPLEQLSPADLQARTSLKWRNYPDDVLPLWVAEMDVLLADPVREALETAVRTGDTGYPVGTGYAEALAEFAAQRWSWPGLAVERTFLVADVTVGLMEMIALVSRPGAAVVINSPVYPPFYGFLRKADRQVVEAPLGAGGRLDLEAVERAFLEHTPAAYLLCNPHNPTGTVHTAAELGAVAALARTHGVRIVSDEIHAPLVLPGATFTPMLSVPGAENAFSVMSASKAWNLAGLKAAVAIAGPESAADLARVPEVVGHGASHLGALAHTAALRAGTPWLDALLAGLADNRRLLGDLLADRLPELAWTPPEGTYLAWIDCRSTGEHPTVPAERYLTDARVALMAGEEFGTGGAGHVRLNFATSHAVLRDAVERMASVS